MRAAPGTTLRSQTCDGAVEERDRSAYVRKKTRVRGARRGADLDALGLGARISALNCSNAKDWQIDDGEMT